MLIWVKKMTKKCFIKGVAIFLSVFQNIKVKDKTQELWYELLKDLTDEQFIYAIKKICLEVQEYYPSTNFIALVREQITVNIDDTALMAWDAVKKTMANKGAYCSVKFSDPVIHIVIKLMASGWAEFCHIPLDKWMQKDFVNNAFDLQDFLCLYVNIGRLPLNAAQGLVDHNPGVGQSVPFTFCPCRQKQRPHTGCLTHTNGGHVRFDILHGIINS